MLVTSCCDLKNKQKKQTNKKKTTEILKMILLKENFLVTYYCHKNPILFKIKLQITLRDIFDESC